jgi:hypothetical protein
MRTKCGFAAVFNIEQRAAGSTRRGITLKSQGGSAAPSDDAKQLRLRRHTIIEQGTARSTFELTERIVHKYQ